GRSAGARAGGGPRPPPPASGGSPRTRRRDAVEPPPIPEWIGRQLPPSARRRLVDVGGARMHVMEWGEGRPVLLQHGNPTWGFLYRKVVAALAGSRLRLVVPDLVGLGFSDKPEAAAHTLDNHARWLGALVDRLVLED